MSWDIRGSQWLNIPLITVMFKSCGKHGRPPPSILLISSSLSCLFPTFSLSLVFVCVCVCVYVGGGPSPMYYLLISTKPLHNPPPLSPPTSVHLFTLVYPVACPFPPKSNPTHPLQEIIPALPEYFIANLANISRHSIDLKSV